MLPLPVERSGQAKDLVVHLCCSRLTNVKFCAGFLELAEECDTMLVVGSSLDGLQRL